MRKYQLKRRAERQAETRRRIVEATAELHATVGPSRTTISAIAQRAGVERLTVYRHFPDEAALFQACSHHFLSTNPPPDVAAWLAIGDPEERLRAALTELYGYYRRTESMLENLLRDMRSMPIVAQHLQGFFQFLDAAGDVLAAGRAADRRLRAALRLALHFRTWQTLARDAGLSDREAADLMVRAVRCVAAGAGP
ncbi:MAG TPA: helix-turn-helix domain-containing protein [Dehalococcoidia bacterium]